MGNDAPNKLTANSDAQKFSCMLSDIILVWFNDQSVRGGSGYKPEDIKMEYLITSIFQTLFVKLI